MKNFKKDRFLLLKALSDLLDENIECEKKLDIPDKRKLRYFKKIRRELDNFMDETEQRQESNEE